MSPAAFPASSLIGSGSVAAPGAGTTVADVATPGEGVYDVEILVALTGTAETQLRNLRLECPNGTAIGEPLPTITGQAIRIALQLFVPSDAANVVLEAVAAATAGSIYTAVMTATRIA